MRCAWLVAPLLIALLLAPEPARAVPNGCCACVAGDDHATTSRAAPLTDALLCAFVTGRTAEDFDRHCENAGGNSLVCGTAPTGNRTCAEILLAEQAIACPAPAPAPAATDWGLTALALALSGLGIAAMRRRAR